MKLHIHLSSPISSNQALPLFQLSGSLKKQHKTKSDNIYRKRIAWNLTWNIQKLERESEQSPNHQWPNFRYRLLPVFRFMLLSCNWIRKSANHWNTFDNFYLLISQQSKLAFRSTSINIKVYVAIGYETESLKIVWSETQRKKNRKSFYREKSEKSIELFTILMVF